MVFGIAAFEVGTGQVVVQQQAALVGQGVLPAAVGQGRGQDFEGATHQLGGRCFRAAPKGAAHGAGDFFGVGVEHHEDVHIPMRIIGGPLADGGEHLSGAGVNLGVVDLLVHL